MNPNLQKDLSYILDTYGGVDGGVGYANFLTLMDDLDRQATNGDSASAELLKVVSKFARLIRVAQTVKYEKKL